MTQAQMKKKIDSLNSYRGIISKAKAKDVIKYIKTI